MKTKLALAVSSALLANAAYAHTQESYSKDLTMNPLMAGVKNLKSAYSHSKAKGKFRFESNLPAEEKYTYIIRLIDAPVAQYQGGIDNLQATALSHSSKSSTKLHMSSPSVKSYASYLKSKQSQFKLKASSIGVRSESLYHYQYTFNGLALKMTQKQAQKLHQLPEVLSIERETMYELSTDVSQELIGSPKVWDGSATGIEAKGEGVIVGIIDSGVNTDHPSFADIGGDGYDHENPWGQGVYVGDCAGEFSDLCNDKLIGVRSYGAVTDNYDDAAVFGDTPPAKNGEDYGGHGSHVASTAVGNILRDVTYVTPEAGVPVSDGLTTDIQFEQMSGVAPHANVVSYQICNPGDTGDTYSGCPGAAIIAALEDAIKDEVDVINYSISGGGFPWTSSTEISFLNARNAGIFVAAAAGNTGSTIDQTPGSSPKHAPWYTSVAASTHDRNIGKAITADDLTIAYDDGSAPVFAEAVTGVLAYAGDIDAENFEACTAFENGAFEGKIALIKRGSCSFVDKVNNAVGAGAIAVVVFNRDGTGNAAVSMAGLENVTIPAIGIGNADGTALLAKLAENPDFEITLGIDNQVTSRTADVLANFSLLGPNPSIDVVAPTVAAPGVDVFAAYSDEQYGHDVTGTAPSDFTLLSGTSMASPHVAGAGALLKSAHPEWTPDNIRSALMLTATTAQAMKKSDEVTVADAFDVGAGRIRVDLAAKAGLIMDETAENYANADPRLGGDPRTLNTPSMADSKCSLACTWTRTVTATQDGTWSAEGVTVSGDMAVSVSPAAFTLEAGESQQITVTANVEAIDGIEWQFANLILTSDDHPTSTMPIAVKPVRNNLPSSFEVESSFNKGSFTFTELRHLDLKGMSISIAGLAKEQGYSGEVAQDSDNSSAFDSFNDGNHIFGFDMPENAAFFTAAITNATAPDLDLFIVADDDRDGSLDRIVASSTSAGSSEEVSVTSPSAGDYYIFVNNWQSSAAATDQFSVTYTVIDAKPSDAFEADYIGSNEDFELAVEWDTDLVIGDIARSMLTFTSSDTNIAPISIPFALHLIEEVIIPNEQVIASEVQPGNTTAFNINIAANHTNRDRKYIVTATIPAGHEYDDILEQMPTSINSSYLSLATAGAAPSNGSTDTKTTITWEVDVPALSVPQSLGFKFTPIKAGQDFEISIDVANQDGAELSSQVYTFDVEDVAPVVMLQAPTTAQEGETVTLSTEGTYEGNNEALTYLWELEAADDVTVDFNATDSNISFIAPKTEADSQELLFTVTITDENGNETKETATITVAAAPAPVVPVAEPQPEPTKKSSGSLGWFALILAPLALLRNRRKH